MLAILVAMCLALPPVSGPVVAAFEPGEGYAGHWGVDLGVEAETQVVAPADGVVTFAGSVAGMKTVTILIQHEVRVSLSYLSSIRVSSGETVSAGEVVGLSGRAHGEDRLHLSIRVGGRYVDPGPYLDCGVRGTGTIRLLPDR